MKRFALVIAALLVLPYVCADVGPSPSYSFAITNIEDYPEYDFFYQGQIMDGTVNAPDEKTYVYKLDTTITIYAVPAGTDLDMGPDALKAVALGSEEISLSSGHTEIAITGMNEDTKEMGIKVVSNEPDVDYLTPDLTVLGIVALGVVTIAVVLGGLYLVSQEMRKKKVKQ